LEFAVKKFVCQYALLRFRPFVETGEFANVGVVFMAPEARYFGFKLIKRYARITNFFSELDKNVYLNGCGLFKEELNRFARDLRRIALDGRKSQPDIELARNLFAELIRAREAMLHFDDQRIVLAEDPKSKMTELFQHYVERNFVTKEYQERLLESSVRKLLLKASVANDYQRGKIGTEDYSVNFPFVNFAEGRPRRVIKPLYLAQGESTKILNHGGQWVDKVRRLRKRNALPRDVLFPVTSPVENTKQFKAYEEIRNDLIDAGVTVVPARKENLILEFVGFSDTFTQHLQ
jgi:hypothetical protein